MSSRIHRRHLLRGMLAGVPVSMALPWLESMTGRLPHAHAGPSGFPTRFCLFYWGNGVVPEFWIPEGDGEDFQLSSELAPLEALKHRITVVSGMSVKVENAVPHDSGVAGLLTGQEGELDGDDIYPDAPTLDQVIAQEIGDGTLYRSLQTGATDVDGLSYNGPGSRNPAETDPYALYERLFGDTFREPGEEGLVDPTLGLRRSVLDGVLEDIHRLDTQVSASDRARLEQHYEGVRELEQRLALLEEDPPNLESCSRPDGPAGDYSDVDGRPQIAPRNQVISELLAMAMACDQTRVVGHYLTDPLTNILFPEASSGHHDLTHNEGGDQPEVHAISTYCMEQLAVFLAALEAIPEGDGTLLEHCSVFACSEVSRGQTHSLDDMPLILAGGGDGFFRTGYHHRSYTQDNATKVLLTLMQSVGIAQGSFGEGDAWTDQVLSEILL